MKELAYASNNNDWMVSTPEEEGMNPALLEGLAPQFEAWTEANVHSILIVRHGKIVCEHYFSGEDQAWGRPLGRVSYHSELKHDVRSITKSIVSLLFGIAIDHGWIGDLDEPVFSFFPEYADLRTPEKDAISLRHLLTMSAGLAWDEACPYSDPANSERRMSDATDRCRYVLEQPIVRPPGATYLYNGGLTALLAAILEKASGRPLDLLANEVLFGPLGIEDVEWVRYADGAPNAVSGLRMRPRDVAKIGQIVLQRGRWNKKTIVSQAWIDDATSAHINGEGLFFYGFQWWLGRSLVHRKEFRWVAGVGYGGQRLFIVPQLDLVVVVMAGLYDNPALTSIPGEVVLRRYAVPAADSL
ncbi:CubicO group peptidase (beta-lactamase class C family) [Trinickia symbiotica]|uniref:Serine hydrolase n=1 Tax=Trinickia symbiotica TaxID=863227 RepID=A0A2N7X6M0_9BURK|nr:serine hydrolase [Trinickia symbiotica]PMS37396.1 serine hydrolase [Trinickia symbiotica]PPK42788.1 CubicO group peptidase (beta-lactamase class C family) [Trinickia symbiotica]